MEELPKIVVAQLAKGAENSPFAADSHPDADLLTAFVERSLPERERGDVMGHLAICAPCREIVALAQPELEEAASPVFIPKPSGSRGRLLRWGLFATCATLALAVVLRQARDVHPPVVALKRAPESRGLPAEADRADSSVDSGQVASGKSAQLPSLLPEPLPKQAPKIEEYVKSRTGQVEAKVRPNQTVTAAATPTQASPAQAQVAVKSRAYEAAAPVAAAPEMPQNVAPGNAALGKAVEAGQGSAQVELAEGARKKSEYAAGAAAGNVVRQENAPVAQKDKDVKEELHASSAPINGRALSERRAVRQAALWQLTPAGELQRSFDSGKGWESVSMGQPARLRVLALKDLHVWVGGNGGMLFHSGDGGERFAPVIVKDAHASLAGDIVVLEFVDAAQGRLETADHEVWATSDGGQTWQKQ